MCVFSEQGVFFRSGCFFLGRGKDVFFFEWVFSSDEGCSFLEFLECCKRESKKRIVGTFRRDNTTTCATHHYTPARKHELAL